MHKHITVFAGSSDKLAQGYLDGAYALGQLLAQQGRTLVYGAGRTGLMGAVAEGVRSNGGEIIGVINPQLNQPNLVYTDLVNLEVVPNLQARQARMSELADAFIALPGGFGTLYEAIECLTWAQLGMHHKGIGFLNLNHYFDPLLELLDHSIKEGFIYPDHRQLYLSAEDPAELLSKLDAYQPPNSLHLWMERP